MALETHEDPAMTDAQPARPAALLIDPFFAPDALAELLAPNVAVLAGAPEDASADTVIVITADRPVRAQDFAHAENLELVLTASVGFDHVDVDGFRARGVKVCHTPGYCTEEVADHAVAAVLSLLRGLHRFDRAIRLREWDIASGGPLRRVRGTKLGIVGLGRIGRAVAERARALGMDVIATHPIQGAEQSAPLGLRLAPLEGLLAQADVVSLHAQSDPGAPPLLGADQLALMRPQALLVNTARAALVDLDALSDRLDRGLLAGAHFDVWASEPPDWDDPRLHSRNLFLSPHAAWVSPRAEEALWREAAHAITAVLAGQDPPHRLA
jgi:D-3-phosphoglycerate dehydrogenase / 2-oxoglutarate reductase